MEAILFEPRTVSCLTQKDSQPSSTRWYFLPSLRSSLRFHGSSAMRVTEDCMRRLSGQDRTRWRATSSRSFRTFFFTELAESTSGQATIEAAVLLPTLMLVIALLVQPVCIIYTRAAMRSAAAEAARAIATDYDGDLSDCRSYVLRRLEAVPDVPLFHSGGASDWSISLSRGGRGVNVEVVGHVRPLPLLGVALAAFSESDGKGMVLRESLREEVRPSWIRGTYGDWQRLWA